MHSRQWINKSHSKSCWLERRIECAQKMHSIMLKINYECTQDEKLIKATRNYVRGNTYTLKNPPGHTHTHSKETMEIGTQSFEYECRIKNNCNSLTPFSVSFGPLANDRKSCCSVQRKKKKIGSSRVDFYSRNIARMIFSPFAHWILSLISWNWSTWQIISRCLVFSLPKRYLCVCKTRRNCTKYRKVQRREKNFFFKSKEQKKRHKDTSRRQRMMRYPTRACMEITSAI